MERIKRRMRRATMNNNEEYDEDKQEFYRAAIIKTETVLDIQLFGSIPDQDDPQLIELIDLIETTSAERIIVTVMSYGGSLYSTLAIYGALKAREDVEIVTIANGMVASGAYHIFMAGDKRYMYPMSIVLIHDASMDTGYNTTANIREITRGVEKLSDKIMQETVMPYIKDEEKRAIKAGRDLWISADEAVERGIAHEIVKPTKDDKNVEDQIVEQIGEQMEDMQFEVMEKDNKESEGDVDE